MTNPDDLSALLPADTLSTKTPAKSRLFPCVGYEGCSMAFTRSEHLARHMRKHTGERPFACCFCSKHFSRLDNLRQHKLTVHADDMSRSDSGYGLRNNIYNGSVYADSHMMGYSPMPNGGFIRCTAPPHPLGYGPAIGPAVGPAISPDPYDRPPPSALSAWPMSADPPHMIHSPLQGQLRAQVQVPYGYCYQQSPSSAGMSSSSTPFSPSCNPPVYVPQAPNQAHGSLHPHPSYQVNNVHRSISAPAAPPQFTTLHYPNCPNMEYSMPEPEHRPLKPMRAPFKPKKRPKHLKLPGQKSQSSNSIISASPSYAARQISAATGTVIEQCAYRTPVLGTLNEFHVSDRLLVHSAPAHQTSFNPSLRPGFKDHIDKALFGNRTLEEKVRNDKSHSATNPGTRRSVIPINAREALGLPLSPDLRNTFSQTCLSSGFTLPINTNPDFEPAPILPPTGRQAPNLPPILPHLNGDTNILSSSATPPVLLANPRHTPASNKDKLPSIKNMLTTDHGSAGSTSVASSALAYEAPF